ncbi:RagB/SusD family nutrient uptake outer membrane protein [Haliscomenobacter sp.]|uniref:RagB/SusD family nutrient uptake outer membrane protein n=1 Tax=Haliscomenobacter sp. TaxID=2717303 RepID=UPI0035934D12
MKSKIHLLGGLALFILVSCQELEREIITDLNKQQIEESYTNVGNLLNAVYSELQEGFQNIDGAMMAAATDEAEFTNETSTVQTFNNGSWNSISNPNNIWGTHFRGIRRANVFLVSTDEVNLDRFRLDPSPSQQLVYTTRLAEVKRWKYEARFLRAFFYFELIKRYGGVPIMTTALTTDDIPSIKRNTLEECIQFITSECDSAATNLPLNYTATNAADLGRATKGAALALKSRVLLYAASELFNNPSWAGGYPNPLLISLPAGDRAARWKAAADAAKALIDLPGTGYALFNNYSTLFRAFNNNEIIFTRRNSASNGFEAANFPIGFDRGQSGTTPSQDLVDAYEIKVNATTSIPFDWSNPNHAANPYATTGATARDPRLALSIVTNNASFSTVASVKRNVETFTGGRDAKPIANASKTGYYLRKYVNEGLNLQTNQTAAHSWIYFRLPEIWLNYAEALNEYSPGNADIKAFYDRVRNRPGVLMPLLPTGLSQAEVREKIRNERRIEFAFEDHRAWDVRRWMTAPTALGGAVRGVEVTKTGTTFSYKPVVVENRVFQPKMYFYPIPQGEINISSALVQNPLW